jgi:hypothetical protein
MNSLWFLRPLSAPAPLCSESEKQLSKVADCWANTGVAEAPIISAAAIEMAVKRMVISSFFEKQKQERLPLPECA